MASSPEEAVAKRHGNGVEITENGEKISEIDLIMAECQKWKIKSEQLQTELDETKSEVTVANCLKVRIGYEKDYIMISVVFYSYSNFMNIY